MQVYETRPYRLGVGIILANKAGLVFVGQRSDTNLSAWQMPQGGIEFGEHPRRAALRELSEEIGTEKAEIVAETTEWITYDLPIDLSYKMCDGLYRGQKQKWYVMRFIGTDSDINISKGNYQEFSSWRWTYLETIASHVVYFKRALYTRLIAELSNAVKAISDHNLQLNKLDYSN